MDSWGILNVDTAAAAISRDDTGTSFRRKNLVSIICFLYFYISNGWYNIYISSSFMLLTTHIRHVFNQQG